MTLEEKDRYIEEKLMQLEPDTLRYMVVDFMAVLEETTTLRDKFAMHALTGLQSHEDDRTYNHRHIHNPEYSALSLDEWRSLLRKQDAELCYAIADTMLEARSK